MHLYINMKQLGKRKNMVDKVAFSYEKAPESLRELIGETVKLCVANYIDRMDKGRGGAFQGADRGYVTDR